jgi:hypothetical protein
MLWLSLSGFDPHRTFAGQRDRLGCSQQLLYICFRIEVSRLLLAEHWPLGHRRRLLLGGEGQRHPGVPAGRPVICGEFSIGLEIEIALQLTGRKNETDLWSDARDPREVLSQNWRRPAIGRELLVEIADGADLHCLRDEL